MDALSDVLKAVRFEAAVYLRGELTAPWSLPACHGLSKVRPRLERGDHVMFLHYFQEGGCRIPSIDGHPPIDVVAGDLVLFTQGHPMLGSTLDLESGDGGAGRTRIVRGYLACSRTLCGPLLDVLPPVLRVGIGTGKVAELVNALLKIGVCESSGSRPGARSALAKVSELLFVEAMRRYVEGMPAGGRGWLAGLRDQHVGRALAAMHAEPERPWTVRELARCVALSRSALAARFSQFVGEPPIQYLMRWRLALAAQSLRQGADPIGRVAERSGYESEAAFSRAFKREFGMPPAAWRKEAGRRAEAIAPAA
jgi:AraC-like DNA-binding protein